MPPSSDVVSYTGPGPGTNEAHTTMVYHTHVSFAVTVPSVSKVKEKSTKRGPRGPTTVTISHSRTSNGHTSAGHTSGQTPVRSSDLTDDTSTSYTKSMGKEVAVPS